MCLHNRCQENNDKHNPQKNMLLLLLYTHRQKTITYISEFKQGKALQLRHTQRFLTSRRPDHLPVFVPNTWAAVSSVTSPASAHTDPVTAPGPSPMGTDTISTAAVFKSNTLKISYFHVPLQMSPTRALTERCCTPGTSLLNSFLQLQLLLLQCSARDSFYH